MVVVLPFISLVRRSRFVECIQNLRSACDQERRQVRIPFLELLLHFVLELAQFMKSFLDQFCSMPPLPSKPVMKASAGLLQLLDQRSNLLAWEIRCLHAKNQFTDCLARSEHL